MANIIGEMPLTNGKWRKLMQMSQATTGRTMPDSTLSAMLKGEYDSIYDNYYRNLSLAQQQANADRNYELQNRQLKMQEEMFDKQNSIGAKLGNAAMQLGSSYAYGAGAKGMDIIPPSIKSGWNKIMPGEAFDFNLKAPTAQAQASTVVPGQNQVPVGMNAPINNVPVSNSAIGSPNELGMVDTISQFGSDVWNGARQAGSNIMDAFGFGGPQVQVGEAGRLYGLGPFTPGTNNTLMSSASNLPSVMPTSSIFPKGYESSFMSEVGIAPASALGEATPGQIGNVATGANAAEQAVAPEITGATTANLATNVVGGLGGTMVGIGVGKMLEGLGIDGPASGFLAGAAGGAVTGAAWGGTVGNLPGAVVGAIVGGVLGLISSLFDSWICGMVDKHVGMTDHEKESMKQLKNWCKVNQRDWLRWYIAHGEELVEFIEEAEDDITDYCAQLRIVMIEPIVALIDAGQMESAYKVYRTMAKLMFYTYAPHIYIPEDSTMKRRYENAESDSALQ